MNNSTLDPVSMNDVTDLDNAPYILEGDGKNTVKIYFETEENMRIYTGITYIGRKLHNLKSMNDHM